MVRLFSKLFIKMYDFNCTNMSFLKNTCRACLKMSEDVRVMTTDEKNIYLQAVKDSYLTSDFFICLYCAQLMKKLNKFFVQCQEANCIIENFIEKADTKSPASFTPLRHSHYLTITSPQTLDIVETTEDYSTPFEEDTVFDDEDIPLVMLKKEDGRDRKKKKKVKKRGLNESENTENAAPIEIEAKLEETADQNSCRSKERGKKPKKEVREGFSSRMVQETEEYVVIKLTKEQVLQEMEERSRSEEYGRALFKCASCVKGFNFEDVLRTHMEKHSMENGSLQCVICAQYCPSVVSLRGHMKSHTTRYKCKVCGCVRQSRQHLLEHHANQHTRGALRYCCHQCDFSTTKRTSMQRHVKSHQPVERHACHRCGKLFKTLETLRVHTMRHDKSSVLQCDTCSRVFIYPSLLHRHVQAVHVRKDYYCVECDTEFKSRENLRLHFKKAKKHRDSSSYQFECQQCPERFVSPSALSTHVSTAHGEQKTHSCTSCRRLYSSRDALRAHARAKHACNRKSVLLQHTRPHGTSHTDQVKKLEDCSMMPEFNETSLLES